jgi:hypothetical protein
MEIRASGAPKRILVIGAGVNGLSTAKQLIVVTRAIKHVIAVAPINYIIAINARDPVVPGIPA